jgi:hypothetical protein
VTTTLLYDGIALTAARPRNPNSLIALIDALPHDARRAVLSVTLGADGSLVIDTKRAQRSKNAVAVQVSSTLLGLCGRHGALSVGKDDDRVHVPATVVPPVVVKVGPVRAFASY